jgi:hypothetical protein
MAIMAMREQNDQLGDAVCLNVIGPLRRDDGLRNPMARGTLQQNQTDPSAPKASQIH